MLVVKDPKRLEAFGFTKTEDGDYIKQTKDFNEEIQVDSEGLIFLLSDDDVVSDNALDTIFDLIDANLVVRVPDDV